MVAKLPTENIETKESQLKTRKYENTRIGVRQEKLGKKAASGFSHDGHKREHCQRRGVKNGQQSELTQHLNITEFNSQRGKLYSLQPRTSTSFTMIR